MEAAARWVREQEFSSVVAVGAGRDNGPSLVSFLDVELGYTKATGYFW